MGLSHFIIWLAPQIVLLATAAPATGLAMIRHVSLLLPLISCCLGLDNGLGLSGPAMGWSSCELRPC
jgi:hypothetical protein